MNHLYLKYRPDIDGLRAIAIVAVVIYHAFPELMPSGFIGVDIFFVISGFLITKIITHQLLQKKFKFFDFYKGRIIRLLPALILMLVACMIFGFIILFPAEMRQLGKHVVASGMFILNFVLLSESGYFDNLAETKPLLHLWSLAIEEQFYLVWPLMAVLIFKFRYNIVRFGLVIGLISFLYALYVVNTNLSSAYYSPFTRLWELLAGSLLASDNILRKLKLLILFLNRRFSFIRNSFVKIHFIKFSDYVSYAGLILLLLGFVVIDRNSYHPGWITVIPILGVSLLLIVDGKSYFNRVVLSNKILVWVGLISYPLYLWHWPILSFARIITGAELTLFVAIFCISLSLILASATYYFVEKPIKRNSNNLFIALILGALIVVVSGLGLSAYVNGGYPHRESVKKMIQVNSQFVGPLWQYAKNDECLNRYPLSDSENYGWWFCMISDNKKPTVLLLGTSYANHFYPGIVFNKKLSHHTVLSIGACDAAWVEDSDLDSTTNSSPCSGKRPLAQQSFINDIIISEKSIKYVFLGVYGQSEEYANKLIRRINFLEENGIKVILFKPHLKIPYDIKSCYSRPLFSPLNDCKISLDEYQKWESTFSPIFSKIAISNPNTLVFNQNELFCDSVNCSFMLPFMPAFRDESQHLSEFASILLFEKFVNWAKVKLPDILSN